MALRVGIDLVDVADVREALRTHAERYLARVFTAQEVADCRTDAGVDPERLAARFAAKEATLKLLRVGEEAIPLRSIEVLRDASGWVQLRLSGRAAELAATSGMRDFAVSLTHEAGLAAAVVVAPADAP